MVGWHHRHNGHESEQTPGVGDGQGSCCAAVYGVAKSWTRLSDLTELKWGRLDNSSPTITNKNYTQTNKYKKQQLSNKKQSMTYYDNLLKVNLSIWSAITNYHRLGSL